MASWQSHYLKFELRVVKGLGHQSSSIQQERGKVESRVALVRKKRHVKYEACDVEGMRAEWVTAPGASPERVILHLHGGAYIVGSVNTHRTLATDLSRVTKARVLVVEYRLAPEHPFPAAVDDALIAYSWLLSRGISPALPVVTCDSAR